MIITGGARGAFEADSGLSVLTGLGRGKAGDLLTWVGLGRGSAGVVMGVLGRGGRGLDCGVGLILLHSCW